MYLFAYLSNRTQIQVEYSTSEKLQTIYYKHKLEFKLTYTHPRTAQNIHKFSPSLQNSCSNFNYYINIHKYRVK